MDSYNTPYNPDSSRNYSRQQTPMTHQYVYDDLSDNLRVSSPFSQDFYQHNAGQNVNMLKKQLNQEIKRHSVLAQQVAHMQYQNQQMRRNQYTTPFNQSSNYLREENQRLREQIARKRQTANVPQQLIDELAELRRQNSWLRQNTASLAQKTSPKY